MRAFDQFAFRRISAKVAVGDHCMSDHANMNYYLAIVELIYTFQVSN
jgi:hypothetical protein